MKPLIKQYAPDAEFYTAEKCYITEISNSGDDPDTSIARARVKPGVTTHWHRLKDTVERYCIISGRGLMELGGLAPKEVNAGDVVIIPAMCQQRITNVGPDDLIFLAVCTPRFTQGIYQDTEKQQAGIQPYE